MRKISNPILYIMGPPISGIITVLELKVTAPLLANALPINSAPLLSVMEVVAKMVPAKLEFVPSVAELPTCQKT
jgi:hypothetical protein